MTYFYFTLGCIMVVWTVFLFVMAMWPGEIITPEEVKAMIVATPISAIASAAFFFLAERY